MNGSGPHRGDVRRVRLLFAGTMAVVLVTALAGLSARRTLGRPMPSLLVDPFGDFSAVFMPGWGTDRFGLRHPDHLVAIHDTSLRALPRRRIADTLQRACDVAARRGDATLALTFERGGRLIRVEAPLRRFDALDMGVFFGLYALAGLFLLWTCAVVLLVAGRRNAAHAYALTSVSVGTFLVTFFDYHTGRALSPLFSLSSLGMSVGLLWLAFAFPEPPRNSPRLRAGFTALSAVALALAVVLTAGPAINVDVRALRMVVNHALSLSLVTLALTVLARFRRASGARRAELGTALVGVGLIPGILGVAFVYNHAAQTSVFHLVLPAAILAGPLSIGYALIRHNILGTTEVLSQRLLVVPNVAVAGLLSMLLWLGLRTALPRTSMDLALPTFLSGGLFVALVVLGHRAMGRWLFPATAHFRPTVQQIADRLATLDHHDELPKALSDAIRLWLPTDTVRLLSPDEARAVERLPSDAHAQLRRGLKVWTDEDPWQRHLLVPMRSLGELRGVLLLAPKHEGALYTSEDLALLDTIASLGAVAMHNAAIMAELDERRRLEVQFGREDKRATLGTLGAQFAHEISHPLVLFRGMLRRAERGELSARDVEVGGDEIARLERLLASMRRLEMPVLRQESVALREPIERALLLLEETLLARGVTASCEVPPGITVLGDRDALVQIFSNLLRNGAQAAPRGGHVGVLVKRSPALTIDVWDDGAGVPEHLVPKLFLRWVTNKEGGTGLGLAVTEDLVRKLQWRIHYLRENGCTLFRLQPRTSDRPTEPHTDPTPTVSQE